jgi:hypothetical protein
MLYCIHFSLYPTTIKPDDTFLPYIHVGQLSCLQKAFLLQKKLDKFQVGPTNETLAIRNELT